MNFGVTCRLLPAISDYIIRDRKLLQKRDKNMGRSFSAAVLVCALCVLGGCGGSGTGGSSQVVTHLTVTAPTSASAGTPFNITVTALNSSNETVSGYAGTVHLTSSDPQAVLPADSNLANGTKSFSVTLENAGSQTITATDTVTAAITGSSNSIDVSSSTNQHGFQTTGDMGTERAAHTATLLQNGEVLITGGFNGTAVLATAELFDPTTGTFSPTGSMTTVRFSHTATLLADGKVLITGGSDNLAALSFHDLQPASLHAKGKAHAADGSVSSYDLATAELYDPSTGTFTATGSMSEVRTEHTATLLANGKVLVAGGTADNVAEIYDPAAGTFSTTGDLVVGGRWGCTATLLQDGTVLIAGGRDDENVFDAYPLNNAELFNPTAGNFTATGSMTQFRYDHTATLLNNGEVLLAGGLNGTPVQDAELFDPTTGSFSQTGSMSTPRADQTATLLNDGTVLMAGSFSYNAPGGLSSAEIFDPTTSHFTPTGSMQTGRFLHTATLLNGGMVLVTGGQSTITIPEVFASSAELYQ
jgi:WD40 repeat protein